MRTAMIQRFHVVDKLMQIVSEHENYSFVMPEITGALTSLFFKSRDGL